MTSPHNTEGSAELSGAGGHTPGPLRLFQVGGRSKRFAPATMEGDSLLTIVFEGATPFAAFLQDEDAHHLQRCWLGYESLLSLLQSARGYVRGGLCGEGEQEAEELLQRIDAAIAKAEAA